MLLRLLAFIFIFAPSLLVGYFTPNLLRMIGLPTMDSPISGKTGRALAILAPWSLLGMIWATTFAYLFGVVDPDAQVAGCTLAFTLAIVVESSGVMIHGFISRGIGNLFVRFGRWLQRTVAN